MTERARRGAALLMEGVVILVSVLGAFLLEGWGNDREQARELREELASVRTELERNRDLADAELASLQRIVAGLDELVARIDGAGGASRVSVPDTLAWLTTGFNPSYSPSLGAVRALISSGRLAGIDDPALRLGLAGVEEAFEDAQEDELLARQVTLEQLAPLLGEQLPLDYSIGKEFFGSNGEATTVQERVRERPFPSYGSVEFPTGVSVRNAIAFRVAWLTSAQGEFRGLRTRLDELIRLTSEELR